MDTKEIFSAVGNFGFPMVLSWYLLLRMEQRLDKLTSCLNELSRALLQKNKEVYINNNYTKLLTWLRLLTSILAGK